MNGPAGNTATPASLPVFYVDAFASSPFTGNPAAVCPAAGPLEDARMQQLAFEIGFSETAFTWPDEDGHRLRWFTPRTEVDLCGHATLATAHILWAQGMLQAAEPARFITRSGMLTVTRSGDAYLMDLPAEPAESCPCPAILPEALGQYPLYTARNRMDYLVELPSARDVRTLRPDFELVSRLRARGLIVTAKADDGTCDFVSRFFAPAAGISEDPVTGSAHCCLGPYWARRLHKTQLHGRQVSERGGDVRVTVREDGRVALAGNCVTVLKGELLV